MAARRKTTPKRKTARTARRKDDNSFLIIVGGGFVIISLILMFTGMLPFSVNVLNVRSQSNQKILGAETQLKMVIIKGNVFSPDKLTITKGTKVVFINNDNLEVENAVANDGSFNTGPLAKGDNSTIEFTKGGIYPYHNANNPQMKGTILVLQ